MCDRQHSAQGGALAIPGTATSPISMVSRLILGEGNIAYVVVKDVAFTLKKKKKKLKL